MINKLKKIMISENNTIIDCMKTLNKTGLKCLIVVDKHKKLLGTLTDGDIRRGILSGMDVKKKKIKTIYSKKPLYLIEGKYTNNQAKKILSKYKENLLPIVNDRNYVVSYINWSEVFGFKKNYSLRKVTTVIMAGGLGTRMQPFTQVLPKPLIPINGKPIIEHIINKFLSYGVKRFNLSVNYKSKILKLFFDELKPNYSVKLTDENKPLGTAGGLAFYKKKINNPFFVTNCDIIINTNYEDIYNFHKKNKNDITIVASAKNYTIPYGVCELNSEGNLLRIKEKPKYNLLTNSGLYILNPNILDLIKKNKFYHMTNLITDAKKRKKKIGVYPIDENSWIDIGQWSEYKKAINIF